MRKQSDRPKNTELSRTKMSSPVATTVSPATAAPASVADDEVVVADGRSRLKRMIMIGLLLAGVAFLAYWWFNRKNGDTERMQGDDQPATIMGTLSSVVGGILGFNRSGDPIMDDERRPTAQKPVVLKAENSAETRDAMSKLASRAKAAGLKLQGVSQCKWTQYQREMFGQHGDQGRKDLESIYTECRSSEMCPNIKGYPTWVHGDRQYPGFKSPAALGALINEVEQVQALPMLQAPSEPIQENHPDAVPALKTGTETMDPAMMYEMMKRMVDKKEADALAAAEADKEQGTAGTENGSGNDTGGGSSPGDAGGSAPGSKCADTGTVAEQIKENVRGVSFHAPLNVPNLPGTAPFLLNTSYAEDQTRQGNAPRMAADSHLATPQLAQQVVSTFNQAQTHEATRSQDAQILSQAKFPHSVDITTGEAFDDKTYIMPKN